MHNRAMEIAAIEGLQALTGLTQRMLLLLEKGDYDELARLLDTRQHMLDEQARLTQTHLPGTMRERLGPFVEELKQVDEKFITLCRLRFNAAADQLLQACNAQKLLAYSH